MAIYVKKYKIWDSHVHLFPPEIYENWEKYAKMDSWFAQLTKTPKNPKATREAWANCHEAIDCATKAGVDGLVMQGWYWNDPELMVMHNDYMAQCMTQYPNRLKGFISINPKFKEKAIDEIQRCVSLGFVGIGELGPGGNGYDFNDSDFIDILQCARHYKLPVCIHCGELIGGNYAGRDRTNLEPLIDILKVYPDLKLILAHLGGGLPFFEMNKRFKDLFHNVRYDIAANPLLYNIRSIKAVIDIIGPHRLFYGSDFPLVLYPSQCDTMNFSKFIEDIQINGGLSDHEQQLIFSQNLLDFIIDNDSPL